jgi:hypothetical protein
MSLLETPYMVVDIDPTGLVVRVRRNDTEYPDVPTLQEDMERIATLLDELGRNRRKLLVDLRHAPRRNDTTFEDAMARIRPRVFQGFRAAAVLVRTAVGALQVKRHMREDGTGAEVFHDEQEALEYLRGQSVRGEVPSSVLASKRTSRSQTMQRVERERTSTLPPPPPAPSEPPPSGPPPPTRPSRF